MFHTIKPQNNDLDLSGEFSADPGQYCVSTLQLCDFPWGSPSGSAHGSYEVVHTGGSVSFSLLLSGPLFELHFTKMHDGGCALEHTVLLFRRETQNIEGILRITINIIGLYTKST